jgi:hypothetical protein
MACLKPGRPGRFFYRVHVHRRRKGDRPSLSEADYAHLITAAHRTLGAGYAPDLNAVEGAWSAMKSSLGNHATRTLDEVEAVVRTRLHQRSPRPDGIDPRPAAIDPGLSTSISNPVGNRRHYDIPRRHQLRGS